MSSITNKIRASAPRNSELLAILSETDHAQPALEQHRRHVDDLNNELSAIRERISRLDKQRAKELKEHQKYRDSVMKRFAYRVSGKTDKFEAKAEKEEKEYFAVLQQERQAKEMEEHLREMRSKAIEVQSDLEVELNRHTEAQQQLDNLYDSIFQGPTPAFPDEDRLEENARNCLKSYQNARMVVETEQHVVHLLTEAQERVYKALNYTEEALSHSRMDMFGGGTLSDMMERNALDKAESQLGQMLSLVRQAQRASQKVQDLPAVGIAQGSLLGDVFFDNIFSDMAFHDKIKDSRAGLYRARDSLRHQLTLAKARHQDAEQDLILHTESLKRAREELQNARQAIFERVAYGHLDDPAYAMEQPPPYQLGT
ncbi:uncharacterized protein F4812DRAFT_298205 [Daldinia caldariorum]|uniref:uncharacterized protein n=1 Tax=Daldinia caldariorum TaxID=326644 RepID=UPI002008E842|nr:uncharacterized protein F4812DRAFT_298205 [Daldinia caldariorum]KAI1469672.1 hypothetical protein F4812DRAFT_298205 [Daldinia caldariorum]